MPKKFNQEIVDVVAALDRADVGVEEITRRLNEGEAGLDHKVDIAQRTVYDYRVRAREEATREKLAEDPTAHSITALKILIRERFAQEIAHLEALPIGKLGGKPATDLHQLFVKLDDMERREFLAQKRGGRSAPKSPNDDNGDQPEGAVERLARLQGTAQDSTA